MELFSFLCVLFSLESNYVLMLSDNLPTASTIAKHIKGTFSTI